MPICANACFLCEEIQVFMTCSQVKIGSEGSFDGECGMFRVPSSMDFAEAEKLAIAAILYSTVAAAQLSQLVGSSQGSC